MSSSSHGKSGPNNPPHNPQIEWALLPSSPEPEFEQPSDLEDTSNDEYEHVYGPAVKATDRNKQGPAPAQVEDQYTHPTEEPEEVGMENVKSQGIAGFMVKVRNRLRTIKDPNERAQARHVFHGLMGRLRTDDKAQSFSQAVAEKVQEFLIDRGLGESLLGDFHLLQDISDERARKHREEMEQRREEAKREKRKKEEWNLIREAEAYEDWVLL
ncbi:hypothetical protein KVR01_006401 [Diaporthe batatas]|uniref:uncharacterized protein n=1 Tax=Diaporthe batatas TaxID=748121 RepID=UPI001D0433D5|nr:uncharacterized protein KVR01_006401 [Diaporthe batatas]KAG8164483.1 hypothetical protein KVR01_006401 [Diaporthe batatas]